MEALSRAINLLCFDAVSVSASSKSNPAQIPSSSVKYRWLALLALLLGLYVVGRASGLLDDISPQSIRTRVLEAGSLGVLLYFVSFSVGLLAHIPGTIFVLAAIFAYGQVLGFVVAWVGAVGAVLTSFLVVRMVGGRALAGVNHRWIARALRQIDERPIASVIAIRTLFMMAPWVNWSLALTNIRTRQYVIGSAVGLTTPIFAISLLFDWLLRIDWISRWLLGAG